MPARKTPATRTPAPIKSVHHTDKRLNIPTEELRDFVADDERTPRPVEYERRLLYPRDPDADPQLVWRGKDAQDKGPLTVPAVPIYIQEKIDPKALVEDLRRGTESPDGTQPSLFADFDGLEGYEAVEFYEHPANWSNRLVLGDALLVMNSLAEKERLRGQVQMIYVDPPYGIKFGSNWQVSTRRRDVRDGKDASRQPEQVKAFRDTWKDGIHSYLTYLRDRLTIARELLTDSGSLFVQIGDENVHLVRNLLDELFGPESFRSLITYRTSVGLGAEGLDNVSNYIVWYSKTPSYKYRPLFVETRPGEEGASRYRSVLLSDGSVRRATQEELADPRLLPSGAHLFRDQGLTSRTGSPTTMFPYVFRGRQYLPTTGGWRTSKRGMERLAWATRLMPTGNTLSFRKFWDDFAAVSVTNFWDDVSGGITSRIDPKVYVVQTATKVVERCILMTTDPGDLVLDPTCGSGTTAYVAEQRGRRWITIDTSRVALALARTRLMAARYPYYLLADSAEGAAKEEELTGQPRSRTSFGCDVRQGFVYKRVPHIMLSSIARNERIVEGMTQEEIERVIAQGAEPEVLVDQPYEDPKKVRVSGRFTVESLSPHRNLEIDSPSAPVEGSSFLSTIFDNLRSSGVHNTFKGERIVFDTLEPLPSDGTLQASGTMTDADGDLRTVAVAIGPEHGTVSPDMVKDAAREALRGAGFDLLVYCGFAFEAYAAETAKEFAPAGDGFATAETERQMGKLRVLLARMNPDLVMSEELLKTTGSGNLFTVFGEPDIVIEETEGGYRVEVRGVDVYDPTTGEVRSSSTDDIACWLIDTDYDGDQFFVRHAYFTGADKPYEKLQRALNADIDADEWATLYSTTSRSFPPPSTGRIAVKVINHYGDEVMQVYDLAEAASR